MTGLRRLLWDEFSRRISDADIPLESEFLAPRAMREFIEQHEGVFRAFGYSEKDMRRLQEVTDAAALIRRTRPASAQAVPPGRSEPKFLGVFGVNQLLSRLYGIQRGVVSGHFVAGETAARFFSKTLNDLSEAQTQATLREALVDPAFAQTLLTEVTRENAPQLARRIRAHLISTGIITAQEQ